MRKIILILLCLFTSTTSVAFPTLEYSVPFTLNGFTYTDYAIFKIQDTYSADYAVVYYANHQSTFNTSECNKDLACEQSECRSYFGYASYPGGGTSGYLLQYNDWCGYIPHFSRKRDKNTGEWSYSGFENQSEGLRVDPTISLSQSTITTFPLYVFNYHPANDDFLGDYGLHAVSFGTVVLEPNVPTFRNPVGSFYQTSGTYGNGSCVQYVRYETYIPYAACNGDAANCLEQAQSQGYPTGNTPRIGSIAVFSRAAWNNNVGHVGIVTGTNGSVITLQDQNVVAANTIGSHDTDTATHTILGYIYFSPLDQ